MMKAAQTVPGGNNNNGTPGGNHGGLLGAAGNLSSASPGPQGQMMPGQYTFLTYITALSSSHNPVNLS